MASVHGQFGGAGYEPPAPTCKPFTCPSGQKAVGNPEHQLWTYGCKDSGMNMFNVAGNFDPNDPLGSLRQGKNVDKCCVERDICKQTCGMTAKACHDAFQKCSKKICGGDQNCQLQAMMSEIMSEPYEEEEGAPKKFDPDAAKCRGYDKGQQQSCQCVPEDDFKSATEKNLVKFYGKFNPEKLDDMGEIKDVDEVWKKWTKKESELFMALATKYKDKAVERREKPKRPPRNPDGAAAPKEIPTKKEADEPAEPAKPAEEGDPEEAAFKAKRVELETKKREAKDAEDYDAAGEAKQALKELVEGEKERLNKKKTAAISDEDYVEAKRIKAKLAKLSEL